MNVTVLTDLRDCTVLTIGFRFGIEAVGVEIVMRDSSGSAAPSCTTETVKVLESR